MHPESSSQLTPIPLESLGHLEHALGDVCTQITSKMHEEARNVTSKSDTVKPQGTYLAWIDCRNLGLDENALSQLMMKDARVYLDDGHIFGPEGAGFARLNLACPRPILEQALDRIRKAVESAKP